MKTKQPKIEIPFLSYVPIGRIDTGWTCCVTSCDRTASVDCCGCKICKEHANEYDHGYGKALKQMGRKRMNAREGKK